MNHSVNDPLRSITTTCNYHYSPFMLTVNTPVAILVQHSKIPDIRPHDRMAEHGVQLNNRIAQPQFLFHQMTHREEIQAGTVKSSSFEDAKATRAGINNL